MDHYCGGSTQWRYLTVAYTTEDHHDHQDSNVVIDACAAFVLIQSAAVLHFLCVLQVLLVWVILPQCRDKCRRLAPGKSRERPSNPSPSMESERRRNFIRNRETGYPSGRKLSRDYREISLPEQRRLEPSLSVNYFLEEERHRVSYDFDIPEGSSERGELSSECLSESSVSDADLLGGEEEQEEGAHAEEAKPSPAVQKTPVPTQQRRSRRETENLLRRRTSFISFLCMSLGYGLWTIIGVLGLTTGSTSHTQRDAGKGDSKSTEKVPFLMTYYAISFGGGMLGLLGILLAAWERTTKPLRGIIFKFTFVFPCLFFGLLLHRLIELSHGQPLVPGGLVISKGDTNHAYILAGSYGITCVILFCSETLKLCKVRNHGVGKRGNRFINNVSFSWLTRVIDIGERRRLEEKDLASLPFHESTNSCASAFEQEVFRLRRVYGSNGSVVRVIWNLYSGIWSRLGLLQLLNVASSFAGPLLMKELLEFLDNYTGTPSSGEKGGEHGSIFSHPSTSPWVALIVSISMALNALVSAVAQTQFGYTAARIQTRIRAGLITSSFTMGLRINRMHWYIIGKEEKDEQSQIEDPSRGGSASGLLMNLLSVDTQKILTASSALHQLWSLPVQLCVTLYLLWLQVSWAFFAGLVVLGIFLPINLFVSKRIGELTQEMMNFRDERLRICEDALKNIMLIKMQHLEVNFHTKVKHIRNKELQKLKARKYWDALCVYLWAATPVLVSLATFGAAALSGHMHTHSEKEKSTSSNLTAAQVFTTLSLLQMLIVPMNAFPWVITGIMEARVSVKRFNRLLFQCSIFDKLLDSKTESDGLPRRFKPSEIVWPDEIATHGNKQIQEFKFKLSLKSVISLRPGELVIVVGRVGSGKTAFLRSFFGDMVDVSGGIKPSFVSFASYAPQRPWIREDTIYGNITCCGPEASSNSVIGNTLNNRYKFVRYCANLENDIGNLQRLDHTVVGERGSTLSGGQQQRIGIARALYSSSSVIILDDPLSALDAFVKGKVRDRVILGLKEETSPPFSEMRDCLVHGRLRIVATHEESLIMHCDKVIGIEQGRVIFAGTKDDFISTIETSDIGHRLGLDSEKLIEPEERKSMHDYYLNERSPVKVKDSNKAENEEFREEGYVSSSVLCCYIKAIGRSVVIVLFIFLVLMQGTRNGSDYWLSQWSNQLPSTTGNNQKSVHSNTPWIKENWSSNQFLYVYIGIAACNTLFTAGRSWTFAYGGVKGAERMHNQLLESVLSAKMYFFQKNPVGRILNRFSSDQLNVDETLPFQANILLAQLFGLIGTCVIILYASSGWLLVSVLPIGLLYWHTQKRYRFTSRELRRLQSVLRTPLYTHFGDCLSEEGSAVIRAAGPPQILKETDSLLCALDKSQKSWYNVNAAVQWLSFRLQCIGVIAISFVAGFAFFTKVYQIDNQGKDLSNEGSSQSSTAGAAGLALSYALPIVDALQGILNSFAETEKEMISVERQEEYINNAEREYDPEQIFEKQKDTSCCKCTMPSQRTDRMLQRGVQYSALHEEDSWNQPLLTKSEDILQTTSTIIFNDVYVRYNRQESQCLADHSKWALNRFSLNVGQGEQLGICGRTGSGKSSLFSTLFRLVTHEHGKIYVDGENIDVIPIASLRSKISVIPQEPVLFEGTVRENLDPRGHQTTAELESVLQTCGIGERCSENGVGRFSLDDNISSSGDNLSMGLRQLLCLARCILQNQHIVCIDEATASVDSRTANKMNYIIHSVFKKKKATVLLIAHRLESLLDCDRIIVLENGTIVEQGPPKKLIEDTSSTFAKLYGTC